MKKHGTMSSNVPPQFYVYALKEQTLSLLDTSSLPSIQFVYDPPQNALYVLKDAKLTRVDTLVTDTPIPLATFAADMARYEPQPPRIDLNALPPGTMAITTSGGTITGIYTQSSLQPVPGNISQLAQNADVQGIVIAEYESTVASSSGTTTASPSSSPDAKVVHVTVRARQKPPIFGVVGARGRPLAKSTPTRRLASRRC